MADLTFELALLNEQATQLLQKYDKAFTRLDEKSQEYASQLAQQIQYYLNQLETAKTDSINEITLKLSDTIRQLNEIVETNAFTRVVSKPKITGSNKASINYQTKWTVQAKSLLNNTKIKEFIINWGDGNTETVQAADDKAEITHTYTGTQGETKTITIIAVDELGNKSQPLNHQITLTDNQPPTPPIINIPDKVFSGADFVITLTGSTDTEGSIVSYEIVEPSDFVFSKTQNISEGEEITVTPPVVDSDTTFQIKAVAMDETGLKSDISVVDVLVRYKAPSGSKTFSTPGTYSWTVPSGVYSITVEVLGAGGGGGASNGGSGGRGGNGGYAKKTFQVSPGDVATVIVGKGGAGGESCTVGEYGNQGDGFSGGTSSFSINGITISATGGEGGRGKGDNRGGKGGTGIGGDVNIKGDDGLYNAGDYNAYNGCFNGNSYWGKPSAGVGGKSVVSYGCCRTAQDGGDGQVKIIW